MKSAASQILRITLIVVSQASVWSQGLDLEPLLPATSVKTQAVRDALLRRDMERASDLAQVLDPPDRAFWLGITAIVWNNAPGAIRILRDANQPKALGVAYYLARQYVLFRDQMAEAIRQHPEDFGPYYYLGRHWDSDRDNAEEAARWFRKALERNPGYPRAHAYLGSCLERMDQPEEAALEYRSAGNLSIARVGLARIRLAAGQQAAALTIVEQAVRTDPRDASARKLAAKIYLALKRPEDALRALEAAAAASPREASTQYQIHRLALSLNDQPKAAAALREFERLRSIYGL